jgi:3-phosphoshikimate 1-carboxyvinyltransferase
LAKKSPSQVSIPANVSSQYISALLLVRQNQDGIKITLVGEITSVQYIKMTLALLNDLDIKTSFEKLLPFIKTSSLNSDDCRIRLELSLLFFSIVALSK